MGTAEFLAYLERLDIWLRREGDRLAFSAPKGALGPDLRAELAPRKSEILAFLRQADGACGPLLPPIEAVAERREAPLAFSQQRLWFITELDPETRAYNIANAVHLRGPLAVAALQGSLREIIRRHEILRTRFAAVAGRPVQVIAPRLRLGVPVVDLSALPASAGAAEARRLAAEEADRLFDLTVGPLLRLTLVRLTDADHLALLTLHHMIADGWSAAILLRELAALYGAFLDRRPSPLPPPAVQYGDFAAWQQQWLTGDALEVELAYWTEQLAGAPSRLELPTDRPRPAQQSSHGRSLPVALGGRLTSALEELSRRREATLFMTVLATFQVLLGRYSGQRDIVVGSPIAGRERKELEGLIGFFVNTVVLRSDLGGDPAPTFRQLLGTVERVALEAYTHQALPFEVLVEELAPERDLSRNPVFQVMFALHNVPPWELELPGLEVQPLERLSETAIVDLTVSLERTEAELKGFVEYNTDLFDPTTIARMAEHFTTLLAAVVRRPDARISELPWLSPAERHQLLEWNDTVTPWPRDLTLHALFESWAYEAPDAVAVVYREVQVSYRELNRRANQLAHHLRGLGVGPEVRVGLCLDRSPELVVGWLGILKAGGAFVPLDPAYPKARLTYMIEDARLPVLVAREHLAGSLPAFAGRFVDVDGEGKRISRQRKDNPRSRATADYLAYVIYTSGSTGRPKGVQLTHRGLSNLSQAQIGIYGEGPSGRVLQFASLSFDASISEIALAFAVGATLCLEAPERLLPDASLVDLLRRQAITNVTLPPSVLRVLPAAELPALRTLLAAGEALSADLVDRFAPGRQLFNAYGPTEGTVCASVTRCAAGRGRLAIGRPIANARIRLLDRRSAPVPAGIPAELHLGGRGLARGYLNQPRRSAEQFIPDPFSTEPGARLYRTGDLARYLPDGQLEFLGRRDDQVKVRGFRIELGEVEAAVGGHPAVAQCAVLARDEGPAGRRPLPARLVAYLVPGAGASGVTALVREDLRHELPEYMVPTAFVELPALPLTASGKVDRRALPALEGPGPEPERAAAPRSELEERIAGIWCRVLGRRQVGREENFFDVGGHSLLAVQVVSQLGEALGRKVPVVEMFEHPTVAALARALSPESEATPAIPRRASREDRGAVAIVGMAGRFPDARDLDELWRNLAAGRESIRFFSPAELAAAGVDPAVSQRPEYVPARGVVADAELFDAAFFDFTPREAQLMDPQQRLLLEMAWEALEDAGCDPSRFPGEIGVFAGVSTSTYLLRNLLSNPALAQTATPMEVMVGNEKDFLATLVSYRLNLQGPGISVSTACSTSLVAVHLACRSLFDGECDAALAGGVTVSFPQQAGYLYMPDAIASSDGHCRPFDARATGTVFGDGVGVVMLKRLADARADGDLIRAVIKGSAINNDGALKIGYTAPSVERQAAVIARAHQAAGVSPETISYVEAHGTGTTLGDPIEVRALSRVFGGCEEKGFCALGSIKSNLGHLDTAAGVAGLIKTVLALEHRQIPPSIHFEEPNPEIDFTAGPFFVNTALREWISDDAPRRAGVSSFGIGGTNVHAVVEAAPEAPPSGPSRRWQLLVWSARTPTALEAATERLAVHLREAPQEPLADVAYSLLVGRRRFPARRALVCHDRNDALAALAEGDPRRLLESVRESAGRPVVFMFPGQGSQYPRMGRDLYEAEPTFRDAVDRCCERLRPHLECDLRERIFPPAESAEAAEELRRTAMAQPALFVVEYALAKLWMEWGVRPEAMIGHSIGEYVAACLAGVFTLEEALALVAERGRLIQELPPGAMLSVAREPAGIEPLLDGALALAAVNAPALSVVAGPEEEVAALARRLQEEQVECRRLHTSHAFHSPMMEPALAAFGEAVDRVDLRPPTIPFLSNLTGTWITAEEATARDYWVHHLRRTVRFAAGVEELCRRPGRILLEVGPGQTLSSLVLRHPARDQEAAILPSMRRAGDETSDGALLFATLGKLWIEGVEIDSAGLYRHEQRRRVRLPGYPFERQRYWIEPGESALGWDSEVVAPAAVPASAAAEVIALHPRPNLYTPYQEPRTETERRLAETWQELLGIGPIGIHDEFFALGGNSLVATQLLSRLRDRFGTELVLRTIFDHGTVAALAQRLEEQEAAVAGEPMTAIVPVARDRDLVLSFAQQRLWFIAQYEPASAGYNLPHGVRISGRLNVRGLARAIAEIGRRQESLRTAFRAVDGRPLQIIAPELRWELPVVDLEALPAARREAESRRWFRADARRPFDLTRPPLLRLALVRRDDDDHLLFVTMHHTISDGWSMGVFIREVGALYQAFAAGQGSPLNPLRVGYADFAAWQRQWLQGEVLESQLAYWRQQLAGAPAALDLAGDRPRPSAQSLRGATRTFRLPVPLTAAVDELGQELGATRFMTLLAAFGALLFRYTMQEEIVVGTAIAGRNRAEIEDLIGFFVNTLALRCDLSQNPSVRTLIDRAREVTLAAFSHQDLPFEQLVEALQPQRDPSRPALVQVMFALQEAPLEVLELPGLRLTPVEIDTAAANFDLTVMLRPEGEGLVGSIEYATDLWDAATIGRMIGHFRTVLAGAVADGHERLAQLPLLTPAETRQVVGEWNDSRSEYPRETLIPQLFERQAAERPGQEAVIFDERLTYRELNRRSNRLAHHLRALGIGPEVLAGIYLPRSARTVVAILGILKASGAYLPLDLSYPPERVDFMLEDSRAPVLITDEELAAELPPQIAARGTEVICLDRDAAAIARHRDDNPEPAAAAGAESPAYVIYTSGSTGRPKGVVVSHRAIARLVINTNYFALGPEDRMGQASNMSFDAATFEIWTALLLGVPLVGISKDEALAPPRLAAAIRERGITVLFLTTGLFNQIAQEEPTAFSTLRYLLFGGEAVDPHSVREVLARGGPPGRLLHVYGPTESTTYTSWHPVTAVAPGARTVPIGGPISNTEIYVLDRNLVPVPAGVPGELCIGGDGLARGYLFRPALTAEKFIP
ncbi:MAG: amino acid adenylation domain-containing protein, partial [bacterium]|nr:amino acid adenylation domain-containing protein [bacterium]